jgi:hypothetical protein
MTGVKALKAIRKGYQVRRIHWKKGEYLFQMLGVLDQHNEIRWGFGGRLIWTNRTVDASEFLSDDWEITECQD